MFRFLYKRSLGPKIQLLGQKRVPRSYDTKTVISKVRDVDHYIQKYVVNQIRDSYLSISCSLHWQLIPMVDLDTKKNMTVAKMWLDDEKIGYIIIQGGPGSFWAFLDRTTDNNREAINTSCMVPGADDIYKNWLNSKKMLVVRGFYKADYEPRIAYKKTDNEIVNSFCDQLIAHYESEKVRWLYKHSVYQSGDLSRIRTEIIPAIDPNAPRKLDL